MCKVGVNCVITEYGVPVFPRGQEMARSILLVTRYAEKHHCKHCCPQYQVSVFYVIAVVLTLVSCRRRESDVDLFTDHPDEYILRDLEKADAETRRRGAIDLVHSESRHV